MSVLIKEMKFPKNCEDCPLGEESDSLYYSCYPQGLDYTHDSKSGRMPNCPLVEIKPHGDLIDKEDLRKEIIHHLGIKSEEYLLPEEKSIVNKIIDAPTIIEKEDGT